MAKQKSPKWSRRPHWESSARASIRSGLASRKWADQWLTELLEQRGVVTKEHTARYAPIAMAQLLAAEKRLALASKEKGKRQQAFGRYLAAAPLAKWRLARLRMRRMRKPKSK